MITKSSSEKYKSLCTRIEKVEEKLTKAPKKKNSVPLPQVKSGLALRLPTDRYCLTQPNYKLKTLPTQNTLSRAETSKPYSRVHTGRQVQSTNAEYQRQFRPMGYQPHPRHQPSDQMKPPHMQHQPPPLHQQQSQFGQTVNVTPQTRHQFHPGAMPSNHSPLLVQGSPMQQQPVHFQHSNFVNTQR